MLRIARICDKYKCDQCKDGYIGSDCQYAVLHGVEDIVEIRDRRSGKTTELINLMSKLVKRSKLIYYLTYTEFMANSIKHQFGNTAMIDFIMGVHSFEKYINELESGYIVTDELKESVVRSLMNKCIDRGFIFYTGLGSFK
jgi:hypothetical protein